MLALWLFAAAVNVAIGVVLALRPDRAGPFLLLTSWTREWLAGGVDVYSHVLSDVDYPPHSIVALSPLALLPSQLMVPLWTAFNVCLALVAPYLAARLVVRRPRTDQVVYLTLLFLSWSGARIFLQFSLLMLVLGLAAAILAESRPALSGTLLGLSLMKPQIAAPFFLWTLFTRRWKVAGVSLAVVAAGTGLYSLRAGTNPVDVAVHYLGILKLYYSGPRAMAGTSQLQPVMTMLFPGTAGDVLAMLVAGALLALICIEGWKREPMDGRVLYAAPCLAAIWSLLTFYHLTYGFVLLLPVAALLLLAPDSEWARGRRATLWVMQFALMFDVPGIWRRAASFLPDARVMDAIFSNADRMLMVALFVTIFALSREDRRQ
jgi:hypothetical protein